LSPAESAILPVVMRSERGVSQKTAPRVLNDARKVATRFPNDPVVLAALAEAETDAGNHELASATADRALALRPDYAKPMIMKARALLAMAEADPTKADWKATRALISKANRLDSDHAEPLVLFYRSFLEQGIKPTRNAVEGLLYAQGIVPQDTGLRMMAVRQLIDDKALAKARAMFGPIANNPHAGSSRERLQQVMQALAQGNGAQATALLDAQETDTEARGQGATGS
jgi:tetratricopeptide (TPR) repeat protein